VFWDADTHVLRFYSYSKYEIYGSKAKVRDTLKIAAL